VRYWLRKVPVLILLRAVNVVLPVVDAVLPVPLLWLRKLLYPLQRKKPEKSYRHVSRL
jgi:uncharacterized membrane protein